MPVAAKMHPINIRFKPQTPARVIREVKSEYSHFIFDDDELVDIETTDWFKEMSAKMKPKDYVRHLREAHGLTQRALGEQLGTNAAHVSDWETGQREIGKNIAKKLAVIFKVNPGMFI